MNTRVPTLTDSEERMLNFIWGNPWIRFTSLEHWFSHNGLAYGTVNGYLSSFVSRKWVSAKPIKTDEGEKYCTYKITPYGLSVLKNWRRYRTQIERARAKIEMAGAKEKKRKKGSK